MPHFSLLFTPRRLSIMVLLAGISCFSLADYSIVISEKLLKYIEATYGSGAVERINDWQAIMRDDQEDSGWSKLNTANKFFNKLPWISDVDHWGQRDYWATPIEMLATNGGDCEDFSIGKYFTLKELKIPIDKIRITYVIATDLNQAHMVLTYYETPDSEPLILDNLRKKILPASARPDLQPIYSFNGEGLWTAQKRGTELKNDSSKLFKWSDLNARLLQEMEKANAS